MIMSNRGCLLWVSTGLILVLVTARSRSDHNCGPISNQLIQKWNTAELIVNKEDYDNLHGKISDLDRNFRTTGIQCGWIMVHQVVGQKPVERTPKNFLNEAVFNSMGLCQDHEYSVEIQRKVDKSTVDPLQPKIKQVHFGPNLRLVPNLVQIDSKVSSVTLELDNNGDCLDQISRLIISGCTPQVPKQPNRNSSTEVLWHVTGLRPGMAYECSSQLEYGSNGSKPGKIHLKTSKPLNVIEALPEDKNHRGGFQITLDPETHDIPDFGIDAYIKETSNVATPSGGVILLKGLDLFRDYKVCIRYFFKKGVNEICQEAKLSKAVLDHPHCTLCHQSIPRAWPFTGRHQTKLMGETQVMKFKRRSQKKIWTLFPPIAPRARQTIVHWLNLLHLARPT